MLKYGKIIDDTTGLVEVGLGTNSDFYKSIGMTEMDVLQSDIDNQWYLADKVPMKTDEELAQEREMEFKKHFFEIVEVKNPVEGEAPLFEGGWYRKTPKGYGSAVESLNTAFNVVSIIGQLPAGTLTFYKAPDFTDPEQYTEEWLIANEFKNETMDVQTFGQFYANFMQAWNTQEHL